MTSIIKCSCEHEWMDKTYGKGQRVMNKTTKLDIYRCTVCGKETTKGGKK